MSFVRQLFRGNEELDILSKNCEPSQIFSRSDDMYRFSIRVIPEGSTASSLAHKMECITRSRMCEQEGIESRLNSYLPATTSITILELCCAPLEWMEMN